MDASSRLLVIVLSRERPESIKRLLDAGSVTVTPNRSWLLVLVDDDDPTLMEYAKFHENGCVLHTRKRAPICELINEAANVYKDKFDVIGFMGDDHLPRTVGWDKMVLDACAQRPRIVYGDDLWQGVNLPTAVFMTSDIVKTLGYFAPPMLEHMNLDNAWLNWGYGADILTYLPNMVIEHLHPVAGKAADDSGYRRVNSGRQLARDQVAYYNYARTDMLNDIEKLIKLRDSYTQGSDQA